MKRVRFIIIAILIFSFAGQGFAENIRRNQKVKRYLERSQKRSFIYYPDSQEAKLIFNSDLRYFLNNGPYTSITIFSWSSQFKRWDPIFNESFNPKERHYSFKKSSPYVIVVTNYNGGDIIFLQIK
ncbi:MAG: hypothetical protein WCZ99_02025 [Candidatus Paceibacterota bacterium]|jgi:hypothetical protein|nr:hypothetical protein [Candidatus Paceibacterota bacterium]MDD4897332.1 hypothetical protein [Candidatus Paceibacterota bacterium]